MAETTKPSIPHPQAAAARAVPALVLLFLLVGPAPVRGVTWHVDPAAASGGDGTAAAPFRVAAAGMAAAAAGDTVRLAAGTHTGTVPLTVYGAPRRALLDLVDGVTVRGAGRGATFLRALPADTLTFGISGEAVGPGTSVADLTVDGACFHAVNLRRAAPALARLDLANDLVGASSVACDVRDASFPTLTDVAFAGGHTALVVEFGSGGTFTDCRLDIRPHMGLICNDATPTFVRCDFAGAGRTVLMLTAGSAPVLRDCTLADGGQWAVFVIGYAPGSTVDLSGNTWFSRDPAVLATRIRDAADDPALGATVIVLPFADGEVGAETTRFGDLKARFR